MMETPEKKQRFRSPAYPAVDLESAVLRASEIYAFANLTPVTISNVLVHWGYSADSSNGMKVVAALGYYGLIDDTGSGDRRKVQLTDRAYRIVLDQEGSTARDEAIQQAALSPTIYSDLWNTYGEHGPDAELRTHLIFHRKFNTNAVDGIISDYRKTVSYAKLCLTAKISPEKEPPAAPAPPPPSGTPGASAPAIKQAGAMNQDTFTIGEGVAVLQWPAQITTESAQDLEDWLSLVMRKIKRNVRPQAPEERVPDGPADGE